MMVRSIRRTRFCKSRKLASTCLSPPPLVTRSRLSGDSLGRRSFRLPARMTCRNWGTRSRKRVTCPPLRSEEHTSELQSLMRISYAVFCLKKKKTTKTTQIKKHTNQYEYTKKSDRHIHE